MMVLDSSSWQETFEIQECQEIFFSFMSEFSMQFAYIPGD